MKKKIGTLMEAELIYKAKQASLSQNKPLQAILEEALSHFLRGAEETTREESVVRSSQGVMKLSKNMLKKVMAEESYHEV